MDVVANAFEVTGAAVIDRQGFVKAAEEMFKEPVPMVKPHGIGAQQPAPGVDLSTSSVATEDGPIRFGAGFG